MLIGQTMFSVHKGTEHRAERALRSSPRTCQDAEGHTGHRVLPVVRHVSARQRAAR